MEAKIAAALLAAVTVAVSGAACADDEPDLTVPSAEQVESYYSIPWEFSVTVSGNVAQLMVEQPREQLERGGRLWARVGPYIYLFSDATRSLFEDHAGLAAVRVVTRAAGHGEVARATLERDALNSLTWRRALNISGLARRDGGERPTLLEDLVRWGQEHTTYEYADAWDGAS